MCLTSKQKCPSSTWLGTRQRISSAKRARMSHRLMALQSRRPPKNSTLLLWHASRRGSASDSEAFRMRSASRSRLACSAWRSLEQAVCACLTSTSPLLVATGNSKKALSTFGSWALWTSQILTSLASLLQITSALQQTALHPRVSTPCAAWMNAKVCSDIWSSRLPHQRQHRHRLPNWYLSFHLRQSLLLASCHRPCLIALERLLHRMGAECPCMVASLHSGCTTLSHVSAPFLIFLAQQIPKHRMNGLRQRVRIPLQPTRKCKSMSTWYRLILLPARTTQKRRRSSCSKLCPGLQKRSFLLYALQIQKRLLEAPFCAVLSCAW
mmetsp:Transcript_96705/g.177803  ORF Transcript_96705/g.177803 Transcript_96705/m.177803 type:complete len:324 (+) Transcript_96705:741-1712(+)